MGIADVLRRTMNYPESEIDFLMKLNSSIVNLPDQTRIQETRVDVLGNLSGDKDRAMRSMVSDEGIPPSILVMLKEGGSFAYAGDWNLEVVTEVPDKVIGVPQGAPTSCSVATLCLRDIETRLKSVLYADDGVYSPETSSDSEIEKVEDPEKGVKLNPNK